MEIRAEQLNILLHAIKDIVKNKNCPDWVAKRLTDAVKNAKNQQTDNSSTNQETKQYVIDTELKPFVIDEIVASNVENDICLYKIIDILDKVGGITLYNLQIINGNKDNPPGLIIHNIPETLLVHIKCYEQKD